MQLFYFIRLFSSFSFILSHILSRLAFLAHIPVSFLEPQRIYLKTEEVKFFYTILIIKTVCNSVLHQRGSSIVKSCICFFARGLFFVVLGFFWGEKQKGGEALHGDSYSMRLPAANLKLCNCVTAEHIVLH